MKQITFTTDTGQERTIHIKDIRMVGTQKQKGVRYAVITLMNGKEILAPNQYRKIINQLPTL